MCWSTTIITKDEFDAFVGRTDLPVVVVSGLAAGADSLVAEEALALGLKVIAALPMPRKLYA